MEKPSAFLPGMLRVDFRLLAKALLLPDAASAAWTVFVTGSTAGNLRISGARSHGAFAGDRSLCADEGSLA